MLGGCGRVAFDEVVRGDAAADAAADDGPALPTCVADDLDSGSASWASAIGAVTERPGEGPDGSTALGTALNSNENLLTHPALAGVGVARVEVDFAIDSATTGDFNVLFFTGVLAPDADGYEAGFFPTTGDNPVDELGFQQNLMVMLLDQHVPTIEASTWHHAAVVRARDGSMQVELDGVPYMSSPPDTTYSPPFTIAFRLFNAARIDNVRVDCAP